MFIKRNRCTHDLINLHSLETEAGGHHQYRYIINVVIKTCETLVADETNDFNDTDDSYCKKITTVHDVKRSVEGTRMKHITNDFQINYT